MKEIGMIGKEEWLREMSDFPYKIGDKVKLNQVPDINYFDNVTAFYMAECEFIIHDIDEIDITLITDKNNFIYLTFEKSRATYWRKYITSISEMRENKLNELGIVS